MFLIIRNVDLQYRTHLLKPHKGVDFSSELVIPCNLSVWTIVGPSTSNLNNANVTMDACDKALVLSLGVQFIGFSAVPLLAIISSYLESG